MKKSFQERVYDVVRGIKTGEVLSYKEVAERAGSPKAYRAVGNILNKNRDPRVSCHRVIKSNGDIGGYNRGVEAKKRLLQKEKALLD